jgi:hypothetical protein
LIAFKEGESSTVSALNVLGRENFTTLLNAFPTVSNFAIDLFSTIGFTSIYLIGVDLGFVDVKHHHSKSSGYYQKNGEETYDFTKSANTSLIVPGNFRPTVNTKHEFKVSRQVIEQVTNAKPKGQEFYNCSDGARIKGTLPIRPDELLIVVTEQQKVKIVEKLKTLIFSTKELGNYGEKFENNFSHDLLIEELSAFETLLEKELTSKEDAEKIISKQKEMLFSSYKNGNSLLFYYMYGTVNYANAVLTKFLFTKHNSENKNESQNKMIEMWKTTISHIKAILGDRENENIDVTSFHKTRRERELFRLHYKGQSLLIISDSLEYKKACEVMLKSLYPWIKFTKFISHKESKTYSPPPDYCIFFKTSEEQSLAVKSKTSTIIVTNSYDKNPELCDTVTQMVVQRIDPNLAVNSPISISLIALMSCFNAHKCKIIHPKYQTCDLSIFKSNSASLSTKNEQVYDFNLYLAVYSKIDLVGKNLTTFCGSRGKVVFGKVTMKDLIYKDISSNELERINQSHFEKMQPN